MSCCFSENLVNALKTILKHKDCSTKPQKDEILLEAYHFEVHFKRAVLRSLWKETTYLVFGAFIKQNYVGNLIDLKKKKERKSDFIPDSVRENKVNVFIRWT